MPKDLKKDAKLTVNDTVEVWMTTGNLLSAMVAEFNNITNAEEKNWAVDVPNLTQLKFSCTIAGFLDGEYGKYPE